MAGEQAVATIKGWIGAITEVALALIALAVVLQVLFGEHAVFLPGDVIGHISGLVGTLGGQGLVGLITLGVLYWVWNHRA